MTTKIGTCRWYRYAVVSSTRSLLVLLSAIETSHRTQKTLQIAQWASAAIISTCVHSWATGTIQGQRLFHSEHGYYSRAATIWGWHLIKEIRYIITIVQSYSGKYHEFVAVCTVTMPIATNEWYFFPGNFIIWTFDFIACSEAVHACDLYYLTTVPKCVSKL